MDGGGTVDRVSSGRDGTSTSSYLAGLGNSTSSYPVGPAYDKTITIYYIVYQAKKIGEVSVHSWVIFETITTLQTCALGLFIFPI